MIQANRSLACVQQEPMNTSHPLSLTSSSGWRFAFSGESTSTCTCTHAQKPVRACRSRLPEQPLNSGADAQAAAAGGATGLTLVLEGLASYRNTRLHQPQADSLNGSGLCQMDALSRPLLGSHLNKGERLARHAWVGERRAADAPHDTRVPRLFFQLPQSCILW